MAVGKIVQVIGTVVDVEFPPDELPNLFDALELDNNGENLVLEVQQHIADLEIMFFPGAFGPRWTATEWWGCP